MAVPGHQNRQLEFGHRFELEDKDLHHLHEEVPAVGVLLFTPGLDTLDQVEEEFAGHGLDAGGQGLVVDVSGIRYQRKEDVEHLIKAIHAKHTFKVDYEAKQYIGIHLDWDYDR